MEKDDFEQHPFLLKLHNTKQIQIKVKSIKKLFAVRKNRENNFEIKKFIFFIFF